MLNRRLAHECRHDGTGRENPPLPACVVGPLRRGKPALPHGGRRRRRRDQLHAIAHFRALDRIVFTLTLPTAIELRDPAEAVALSSPSPLPKGRGVRLLLLLNSTAVLPGPPRSFLTERGRRWRFGSCVKMRPFSHRINSWPW